MKRTAFLIAALTTALYLPRLGTVPAYLAPDEVFIALHAQSIASTGRDYGGRLLPLFVEYRYVVNDPGGQQVTHSGWLPPAIYYLMALVLRILPLSEWAVRFSTVLVGVTDVVLMYFIGRTLFKNEPLAILAASLLAITPAHVIHSRLGMDYLYPVPFLLASLLALLRYFDSGRLKLLFISTLALGAGLYSYIAAGLAMPLYLLVTLIALAVDRRPSNAYGVAALGFLVPAALYLPWHLAHPTALIDVLGKYGLGPEAGMTTAQSLRAFLSFHNIGNQLSHLWAFFDPRFLFFDGPMELMYSTRTAGVFVLPVAALLIAGIASLLRAPINATSVMLLAGMLVAPVPATLVGVRDAIYRALELLPFVILIAVCGVRWLWASPSPILSRRAPIAAGAVLVAAAAVYAGIVLMRQARLPGGAATLFLLGASVAVAGLFADRMRSSQVAAALLVAIAPVQFAFFYADYLTDYPRRTSLVFSGNIRGAFEETLRQTQHAATPSIYLGRVGPYGKGGIYWIFYIKKHGRDDLAARTIDVGAFDAKRVLDLKPGSLVVTNAGEGETEAVVDRLIAAGQLSVPTIVSEPDGTRTFLILRRTGA